MLMLNKIKFGLTIAFISLISACGGSDGITHKKQVVNTAPIAITVSAKNALTGSIFNLDGRLSLDADSDPLTYDWIFALRPQGSEASIHEASTSTPSFIPDVPGRYVVTLIVNDGKLNSIPHYNEIVAVAPNPLDKYIGIWIGCADYQRYTVRISRASASTLSASLVGEVFNNVNCAGNSVGTMIYSDPLATLAFQSTETILVEDPMTYPVRLLGQKLVDRFRTTTAGGMVTFSGPNLVGNCIIYNGGKFCTNGGNPESIPIISLDSALHLTGSTLTLIRYTNGKFVSEEITLTKL
jgi:hypothetical protein